MEKVIDTLSNYKKTIDRIRPLSKLQTIKIHKALGDTIRYDIWLEISNQPGLTGKELLAKFKISQPSLSFHIAKLIRSGIIADLRDGQSHTYYPNFGVILSYYKTIFENKQIVNNQMHINNKEFNKLKSNKK